jgi:hypothetical protein
LGGKRLLSLFRVTFETITALRVAAETAAAGKMAMFSTMQSLVRAVRLLQRMSNAYRK